MKFLIDADCPRSFGIMLREAGHTVEDIRDRNPHTPDDEIFQLIQKDSFILITRDTDFSNILRYRVNPRCGIILLRLHLMTVDEMISIIKDLLTKVSEADLLGSLTVVNKIRYRIHKF